MAHEESVTRYSIKKGGWTVTQGVGSGKGKQLIPKVFASEPEATAAAKARSRTFDRFDPEGAGYDYLSAQRYGLEPSGPKGKEHWPSRVPGTGLLLKGRQHETWHKTVAAEKKLGMGIFQVGTRSYSQPVAYSNADKQRLLDLAFLKGQRQK